MSDVTARHRNKAENIALHLYGSEDFWGQFCEEFQIKHGSFDKEWWVGLFTTFIAEMIAEIEGDPPQESINAYLQPIFAEVRNLAGIKDTPLEGLEDAVQKLVRDKFIGVMCDEHHADDIINIITAAVQPLFGDLQNRYDTMLHNDAYQIKLLQADNDALKKQVEKLQEEREGAYKHGYEDAGGSR